MTPVKNVISCSPQHTATVMFTNKITASFAGIKILWDMSQRTTQRGGEEGGSNDNARAGGRSSPPPVLPLITTNSDSLRQKIRRGQASQIHLQNTGEEETTYISQSKPVLFFVVQKICILL